MKKLFSFTIIVAVGILFLHTLPTFAENDLGGAISEQLDSGAQGAEIGEAVDPRVFIAELIQTILTIIGTLFMGLMVLGGYWWLTDRGEEEKVEKAKKTIAAAIVGLVVVLMAYGITLFVARLTQQSVQGEQLNPQGIQVKCNIIDMFQGECKRENYSELY